MNLLTFLRRTLLKPQRIKQHARLYNDISLDDIPGVSASAIKKSLSLNGFSVEEGHTCFIVKCFMCKQGKSEPRAKLYINKTTGMYMCSYCKHTGQWDQLSGYLSLSKIKRAKVTQEFKDLTNLNQALEEVKKSTSKLSLLAEQDLHAVLEKFKLPAVNHSCLDGLDIRTNDKHTQLYFPLENVDSEPVGYRTLHCYTKQENLIPNIQCGGVLTWRLSRTRVTAVLVPTIADFLILLNSNIPFNLVCLPDGVNTLSQYVLPSLERFKKVVLWLGSDNKAWDSAKHFAKKLSEKRCAVVRPNEPLPHLQPEQDFKAVIGSAQVVWHRSITTFSSIRSEVWSDLLNVDKVQGIKWKRFPTLNKVLLGHRRGELTILTGPTGSGKTTFMSEYSLDLAMQGVNTLWGSFEIRNARLAKTMLQQMAGFPLEENLERFEEAADAFEKFPIYFMTFHGQQNLKVVMDAVEHASYVYDIGHVIIDNVQFMMGTTEEHRHMDRFWKQDAIIAAFRTFATKRNCHVTLVIHPRKERDDEDLSVSSIFGGAKASQEADNVLLIQDKRLTSIRGKKYLQVAKNRYGGDLGMMALDFNKSALSYAQKKPKEDKKENTVIDNSSSADPLGK